VKLKRTKNTLNNALMYHNYNCAKQDGHWHLVHKSYCQAFTFHYSLVSKEHDTNLKRCKTWKELMDNLNGTIELIFYVVM
jgi:hypothetical protein